MQASNLAVHVQLAREMGYISKQSDCASTAGKSNQAYKQAILFVHMQLARQTGHASKQSSYA